MGHWDTAIMLYNDNHLVLGSLCNEMIYIKARCLYEAGLQLDRNTPVRINYFNLGLDLVTRIASSRQNANVKFDLLIPQINMAMGNHMAAYESATVLLTRSTLSSSKYAELLMLRARASRMIGDSAAAMNDYYTAIEAANYTNNWALLGVLHADIIGYSRNNQLEYSNDVSMHVASEFTAAGHLAAVNHKVLANHYFRITNVNNNRDLETSRYTLLSVNNSRRFAENVNITAQ
jgi:tetratricopeptide (TPR) repeat protein